MGSKTIKGIDEFKKVAETWYTAIPTLHYTIDETIISGDKVVIRWHAKGILDKPFMNLKPEKKPFEYWGISIISVRDGKFQEAWVQDDKFEKAFV